MRRHRNLLPRWYAAKPYHGGGRGGRCSYEGSQRHKFSNFVGVSCRRARWFRNCFPFAIDHFQFRSSRGFDSSGGFLGVRVKTKVKNRSRSDTVLVLTINHADERLEVVIYETPAAPYEKSKSLGAGGDLVARLKLRGIDGRASPGVGPAAFFDATRGHLPRPDVGRTERLLALFKFSTERTPRPWLGIALPARASSLESQVNGRPFLPYMFLSLAFRIMVRYGL